jgi:cytosine/adenosine deaminase-related metal-dependent hydrolase
MWDAAAIPRGSRPLDYLGMLAEAPRALVIHGNFLDSEERSYLAANADRMSLVCCPRTHSYFGHPPYPLPQLLRGGVRVALGTDSRASNPDLDLLAEMRCVAQTFPTIDPRSILRMGTLAGAEALGRAADVGSITAGKLANLVAVPLADEVSGSADDLLAALLAADRGPRAVWVRGERV